MDKQQQLVVVGVLANDEQAAESIREALEFAVRNLTLGREDCRPTKVTEIFTLGVDGPNAKRCSQCNRWATDIALPDQMPCLTAGRQLEDGFYCQWCRRPPWMQE